MDCKYCMSIFRKLRNRKKPNQLQNKLLTSYFNMCSFNVITKRAFTCVIPGITTASFSEIQVSPSVLKSIYACILKHPAIRSYVQVMHNFSSIFFPIDSYVRIASSHTPNPIIRFVNSQYPRTNCKELQSISFEGFVQIYCMYGDINSKSTIE